MTAVAAVIVLYLLCGQNVDITIQFFIDNWKPILLAVQIILLFILAVYKQYLAGVLIIITTIITIATGGVQ